jgi:hypothetical protein
MFGRLHPGALICKRLVPAANRQALLSFGLLYPYICR